MINNTINQALQSTNTLPLSDKRKIGKSIYIIKRHFSGERDMKDAVYAVVKNEAFRTDTDAVTQIPTAPITDDNVSLEAV